MTQVNDVNPYEGYDFTIDSYYEKKQMFLHNLLNRVFRRDKYERYKLTFECLGDLTGHSVMDIGCGSGIYMIEALHRGAEFVTGVDPSLMMLSLAKERLSYGNFKGKYILIQERFPEMKLPVHDFVISTGVMEQIGDPVGFLSGIRKSVKISAFVSFPGKHRLLSPIKKLLYLFRRCSIRFYGSDEIMSIGKKAGFSHIDIKKIPGLGVDFLVILNNNVL